ncbi:hypothetical protein DEMA109039_09695 [Deinococcus marmoris]
MERRSPVLRVNPRGASRLLGNDCRCTRSGLCADATCVRRVLPRRAVMRRLGCRCRVPPILAWWLLHGPERVHVSCRVELRNCCPLMNRRSYSVSARRFPLPSLCAAGPVGLPSDAVRPLPRTRISYWLTAACGCWSGLGVALSSLFSAAHAVISFSVRCRLRPLTALRSGSLLPARHAIAHPAGARGHGPRGRRSVCHPLCCAAACHSRARGSLSLCWASPCTRFGRRCGVC